MCSLQPYEVMGRGSETELQVGENVLSITLMDGGLLEHRYIPQHSATPSGVMPECSGVMPDCRAYQTAVIRPTKC